MIVVSVLNQKGGVGKTTLAIHLATAYAMRGEKVILIDADPQNSALAWSDVREAPALFPVIGKPSDKLHREVASIGEGYDRVVIDGAPRTASVTRAAIAASDVVLIPVQPSGPDIWSTREIVSYVEEARTFKPHLHVAFVINRKIVNTAIGREVRNALSQFNELVLEATVAQRVSFAETITAGTTVLESGRAMHQDAAAEILAVVQELDGLDKKEEVIERMPA